MNLAAFAVIVARERETPFGDDIRSVAGLGASRPVAGLADDARHALARRHPATAGFIGKFTLIEPRGRRLHVARRGDRRRVDDLARLLPARGRGDVALRRAGRGAPSGARRAPGDGRRRARGRRADPPARGDRRRRRVRRRDPVLRDRPRRRCSTWPATRRGRSGCSRTASSRGRAPTGGGGPRAANPRKVRYRDPHRRASVEPSRERADRRASSMAEVIEAAQLVSEPGSRANRDRAGACTSGALARRISGRIPRSGTGRRAWSGPLHGSRAGLRARARCSAAGRPVTYSSTSSKGPAHHALT